MLLEGLHIPLTTPFHPDGRLNPRKLAANVDRYCRTPAAGLIVLGPSGEPSLLTDDETREVLRTVAESSAPEKVLIADISRDSVRATLVLADLAASLNYDAILVGAPSILASGPSESIGQLRELLTYFQALADRSPLPIVLLSVPRRAIPSQALVELAAHSRIIALLDAQRRDPRSDGLEQLVRLTVASRQDVTVTHLFAAVTNRMTKAAGRAQESLVSAASLTGAATAVADAPVPPALRTRQKTVGFQILAGDTGAMLDGLIAGAIGVVPAFAACAPQACYEVFAAWKDIDQLLAEEKQARLIEASHLAESLGPGGLKFACDLNGYFGGPPRLPHLPPTGAQRAALERMMKPLRS
jgi:dihydrodipicolinate synthase/N-acetylneuraminate lyase